MESVRAHAHGAAFRVRHDGLIDDLKQYINCHAAFSILQFRRIWGVAVDFLRIEDLFTVGPLKLDVAVRLLFVERFAHRNPSIETAAIAGENLVTDIEAIVLGILGVTTPDP